MDYVFFHFNSSFVYTFNKKYSGKNLETIYNNREFQTQKREQNNKLLCGQLIVYYGGPYFLFLSGQVKIMHVTMKVKFEKIRIIINQFIVLPHQNKIFSKCSSTLCRKLCKFSFLYFFVSHNLIKTGRMRLIGPWIRKLAF